MKKVSLIALLALIILGSGLGISQAADMPAMKDMKNMKGMKDTMHPAATSASATGLRLAMRTLWEDHIGWTRGFIISALADDGATGVVAERLLKNQDDIGNAIKPFYGDAAGQKLSGLLRDHILIAAKLVAAAKAGNNEEVGKEMAAWNGNADDIATFLSGANPNWQKDALQAMLYNHLGLTVDEVTARLKKDWAADIKAYDMGHAHILAMADVLTDGIVKQFPKKFK